MTGRRPSLDCDNPTHDDVQDAHLMCLFWTTYAQVLTVICSVSALSPPLADGPDTDLDNAAIRACCESVARTAPVFLVADEAGAAECPPIVSFPMFFALQGLMLTDGATVPENRSRLLALFTKPAKGGGSLARFVVSLLEHSPVLRQTEAGKALATLVSQEC